MQVLLKNILRQKAETAQAAWKLLKTLHDYRRSRISERPIR